MLLRSKSKKSKSSSKRLRLLLVSPSQRGILSGPLPTPERQTNSGRRVSASSVKLSRVTL